MRFGASPGLNNIGIGISIDCTQRLGGACCGSHAIIGSLSFGELLRRTLGGINFCQEQALQLCVSTGIGDILAFPNQKRNKLFDRSIGKFLPKQAMAPATWGAAIEVPDSFANFPSNTVDRMPVPGAAIVTYFETLEYTTSRSPVLLSAATETADEMHAGSDIPSKIMIIACRYDCRDTLGSQTLDNLSECGSLVTRRVSIAPAQTHVYRADLQFCAFPVDPLKRAELIRGEAQDTFCRASALFGALKM